MEYLITGALIGVCLFIIPMWSYRRGLRDGLAIHQGKPIEPIKSPIQSISEHRENKKEKKEADKISEGLANLLSYDGTAQKEVE